MRDGKNLTAPINTIISEPKKVFAENMFHVLLDMQQIYANGGSAYNATYYLLRSENLGDFHLPQTAFTAVHF